MHLLWTQMNRHSLQKTQNLLTAMATSTQRDPRTYSMTRSFPQMATRTTIIYLSHLPAVAPILLSTLHSAIPRTSLGLRRPRHPLQCFRCLVYLDHPP